MRPTLRIAIAIEKTLKSPFWFGFWVTFFLWAVATTNLFKITDFGRNTSLDALTKFYPFESLYPNNSGSFVFVNIDDNSLKTIGQWPWPRQISAKLIDKISQSGAAAIGVDILFAEKDRFSPDNLSQSLGISKKEIMTIGALNGDKILGEIVKETPAVLAFALSNQKINNKETLANHFVLMGEPPYYLLNAQSLIQPIPELQGAKGMGFVNTNKSEGMIRETPLVVQFQDNFFPSLALDMLRVAQGADNHVMKQSDLGESVLIKTGQLTVRANDEGSFIFHHGHMNRFTQIPASEILSNQTFDFKNKIVIIGASAAGLGDIHSSNLEDDIPGPLFHLQLMDQVLSDRYITYHVFYDRLIFLLCAGLSILFSFLMLRVAYRYVLIGIPALAAILIFLSVERFLHAGFIFNTPIALVLLFSGSMTTYFNQIAQKIMLGRAVEKDIADAKDVQTTLFPAPDSISNISGGVIPYKSLSGDFIDYFKVGNKICFIEGDVSGKGIPSALLMARSVALFRLFARHNLAADMIAKRINDELYSHGTADKFVTSVMGWYDMEKQEITFVNCGHNPVLLIDETTHQLFDQTSPPLGVVGKEDFSPSVVTLAYAPKNVLYIVTDGISEAMIKVAKDKEQEIGMEGLLRITQKQTTFTAMQRVEQTLGLIRNQKLRATDDATILVIMHESIAPHETSEKNAV
ncbi:COG4252 Predicted transmembrane sensor domain [Candidatus Methylopumilus universalis]|jgi:adenylate cyclase|uniref:CHASE2 domain-containing protein n=1 Tax=Candidatus Methylopumilus universalis TaxID=2588536 RepID=UPI003BEED37A